ncbi:hypothetical protein CABS01_01954 [Colletotrichum abscissum]|uniref:uncharacterized protein n=1 Tax=Colletotrichum abscissum TaxID=1671311 RepID=UPI0027D4D070|nr:uncharacterized protein CABS01_01954 [Colletotrichum abscissum]KAK1488324.1 hypothetical protein CABS01_01954 [Colletotrichum abscissum]
MVRRMGLAGLPFTRTDVRHRPCSRSGVTASALPDDPFLGGFSNHRASVTNSRPLGFKPGRGLRIVDAAAPGWGGTGTPHRMPRLILTKPYNAARQVETCRLAGRIAASCVR